MVGNRRSLSMSFLTSASHERLSVILQDQEDAIILSKLGHANRGKEERGGKGADVICSHAVGAFRQDFSEAS